MPHFGLLAPGVFSPCLGSEFLRWKGIEATEKLASSQNTEAVIVGAGKDGLPVILDTK